MTTGVHNLCQEQLDLALQASYESESILKQMNKCLGMEPDDSFLRAFVVRLHQLNSLQMLALSGADFAATDGLRQTLEGIPA